MRNNRAIIETVVTITAAIVTFLSAATVVIGVFVITTETEKAATEKQPVGIYLQARR